MYIPTFAIALISIFVVVCFVLQYTMIKSQARMLTSLRHAADYNLGKWAECARLNRALADELAEANDVNQLDLFKGAK